LGLAIARTAVQAHRGTIWAASRPGGGLIVTLQLPLQPPLAVDHAVITPRQLA
jgi:signal transduction histidine kinase